METFSLRLCIYIKYTHLSKCNSELPAFECHFHARKVSAFNIHNGIPWKQIFGFLFRWLRVYSLPPAVFLWACRCGQVCCASLIPVIIAVAAGICQCLGLSHTCLCSHSCSGFLGARSVVTEDPVLPSCDLLVQRVCVPHQPNRWMHVHTVKFPSLYWLPHVAYSTFTQKISILATCWNDPLDNWVCLVSVNCLCTSFSQERTLILLFLLPYQILHYSLVHCTDTYLLIKWKFTLPSSPYILVASIKFVHHISLFFTPAGVSRYKGLLDCETVSEKATA